MTSKEKNAYILGTERAELHRLGLQHQVWSKEALKGWELAGFTYGDTILDLGCGPGFSTLELAYMVGDYGKVIGVDKSEQYIDFLTKKIELHDVPVEPILSDFDSMKLQPNSLDGAYCRWALAWIPNPKEIIEKVKTALKPGGIFVVQEYFDWSTFQTEPRHEGLAKGIKAALQSFKDSEGDIDVGRKIPGYFESLGMDVLSSRPMSKLATPDQLTWSWPETFMEIYLPKLMEMGLLTQIEVDEALSDFEKLSVNLNSVIFCPFMIETMGQK